MKNRMNIKLIIITVLFSLLSFNIALASVPYEREGSSAGEATDEIGTEEIDGDAIMEAIHKLKDIEVEKQEKETTGEVDIIQNLKKTGLDMANAAVLFIKSNIVYISILGILTCMLLINKHKRRR